MSDNNEKMHPWRVSHTDLQWWTDEPLTCFTCGDQDRLMLDINGERLCDELGTACTPEAIPTIAQYLRNNSEVPHWARSGYPMVHDPQSPPDSLFTPGPSSCRHAATIQAGSIIEGTNYDVTIDGRLLDPRRSLKVYNHSPSGFSWGYGGSGPAQLALALLLEGGASDREANRFHQQFKQETIAILPSQTRFLLSGESVLDWLHSQRENSKSTRRS